MRPTALAAAMLAAIAGDLGESVDPLLGWLEVAGIKGILGLLLWEKFTARRKNGNATVVDSVAALERSLDSRLQAVERQVGAIFSALIGRPRT